MELIRSGAVYRQRVPAAIEGVSGTTDAYEAFDARRPGWLKFELEPAA